MFRNDCGVGYHGGRRIYAKHNGTNIILNQGDTAIINPKHVTYGLLPGSSDFIGFLPLEITPDMVGKTIAVFQGIEMKIGADRLSEKQRAWNRYLMRHGAWCEVWCWRGQELEILTGNDII